MTLFFVLFIWGKIMHAQICVFETMPIWHIFSCFPAPSWRASWWLQTNSRLLASSSSSLCSSSHLSSSSSSGNEDNNFEGNVNADLLLCHLFRNATATIQVFSVSLSLKAGISREWLLMDMDWIGWLVGWSSCFFFSLERISSVFSGAWAEDGEKEGWRTHLPDVTTHCGKGSNRK